MSLWSYITAEVTRGYQLENDEERFAARREKMYTFLKIPTELEKFMGYGFFQCLDSFLSLFTFLPLKIILIVLGVIFRPAQLFLGYRKKVLLTPAEICDILKSVIIVIGCIVMTYIDTSVLYHIIKSQSVIKLYIFFNMLEVGDRLFSTMGQDTLDALFWTATEPPGAKQRQIGLIPHFALAIIYVSLHAVLVLLQATTLNVAINASNKALLTIMMSNNFVEIKGSVFKKFDKNNLFQVSCNDVRERFHLCILLILVVIQTMKEYSWKEEQLWILVPDCLVVLASEIFVDWIKHAFITRFNEIHCEVYRDYTISLAYDLASCKQKQAFSDYSDLVARRMGFIPIPLAVVIIRIFTQAFKFEKITTWIILFLGYLFMVTLRLLISIVILGKACDLIDAHRKQKDTGRTGSSSVSSPEKKVAAENKPESCPGSPGLKKSGSFFRSNSQPSSRKPSFNKLLGISQSAKASVDSFDDSLEADRQKSLLDQQRPLFANSTVSLNSLELNEALLETYGSLDVTDGKDHRSSTELDECTLDTTLVNLPPTESELPSVEKYSVLHEFDSSNETHPAQEKESTEQFYDS